MNNTTTTNYHENGNVVKIVSYRTKRTRDESDNYLLFKVVMLDGKQYNGIEVEHLQEDCPVLLAHYIAQNKAFAKKNPNLLHWSSAILRLRNDNTNNDNRNNNNNNAHNSSARQGHHHRFYHNGLETVGTAAATTAVRRRGLSSSSSSISKPTTAKSSPEAAAMVQQQQRQQKHLEELQQHQQQQVGRTAYLNNNDDFSYQLQPNQYHHRNQTTPEPSQVPVPSPQRHLASSRCSNSHSHSQSKSDTNNNQQQQQKQQQLKTIKKEEDEETVVVVEQQQRSAIDGNVDADVVLMQQEKEQTQHQPVVPPIQQLLVRPTSSSNVAIAVAVAVAVDVDVDVLSDDISKLLGIIDNHVVIIKQHRPQQNHPHDNDEDGVAAAAAKIATTTLDALEQLQQLLSSTTNPNTAMILLEHFHCLGGISRILQLVSVLVSAAASSSEITINNDNNDTINNNDTHTNSNSITVIGGCAELLSLLLSFRWSTNTTNQNIAIEMTHMFVRRNGIELFLQCSSNNSGSSRGGTTIPSTKTSSNYAMMMKHLWIVLGRLINISHDNTKTKTTTSTTTTMATLRGVDKKRKLDVLQHALEYISKELGLYPHPEEEKLVVNDDTNQLHVNTTTTAAADTNSKSDSNKKENKNIDTDVLQAVLYTIANSVKDDSLRKEEIKDLSKLMTKRNNDNNTNTTTTAKSTNTITIVSILLQSSLFTNTATNTNEQIVAYTLGILTVLAKKKVFGKKKKELELLLPILVHCTNYFKQQNPQIVTFVLLLLELSCDKLHKKTLESAGVLEAISSALLKPGPLSSESTKEKARCIMRRILN